MAKRKKKQNTSGRIQARDLLRLFREQGRPLSRREIYEQLKPGAKDKKIIRSLLDSLVDSGKLIKIGKGYGLVEKMPLTPGRLEVQRSGVGFVIPDDKRLKDIFVAPDNFGDAWHGDRVMVAKTPGKRGRNPEGRIARLLERGCSKLPIRVTRLLGDEAVLGRPTSTRHNFSLMVDITGLEERPKTRDILLVAPGEKIEPHLWGGEALEYLGAEEEAHVQEDLVKASHSVPTVFPERALHDAQQLPDEPDPEEVARRADLRHLPFVTIDGAKAKDFDDAIHVAPTDSGYTLHVAIADVSHYVHPGSALDKEAQQRGNSYYFPQSVEPMLPEKLSNGLCSLRPNVDRLVMVAEMDFTRQGKRTGSRFYPAVLQSAFRLTYAQVKQAVLDRDPAARDPLTPVLPMLENAEALARSLLAMRQRRGTMNFDLPEPEIHFNLQDEAVDIRPRVRHFGHQIIEECMIAANEAVAEFLRDREEPCMFRVHPPPDSDKLETLFRLLAQTDLAESLPQDTSPKDLQELLTRVEGTKLEFLVNRLLLRTMMQAYYSPKNDGHFGLASECYCHFTSPIRRYADLVVHRYLKRTLAGEDPGKTNIKRLTKIADHISQQERRAMEAEREILKRLTILFLRDHVGRTFTGVIASLADFGFWVELDEVLAEGMVRLSTLNDDYYVFWPEKQQIIGERTGQTFRLGQEVRVTLTDVNLDRLEVNLALEEKS